MKRQVVLGLTVVLTVLALLGASTPGFSQPIAPPGAEQLKQDAGGQVEFTWNPRTDTPSFVRGRLPLAAAGVALARGEDPAPAAAALLNRYAVAFGLGDATGELAIVADTVDPLGMRHVTLRQVYRGVEVYDASVGLHLSADGQVVVAIANGFVPGIRLPSVEPNVSADQAAAAAHLALPNGELVASPRLVVYPGAGAAPGPAARLAWLVELRDLTLPAHNLYVVDAATGRILGVLDRLYDGRDRKTYTANHTQNLPGTLARVEGQGPTGDADVDHAHDFAGNTYDYFWNTHGRDSFDNQGATIISTVHYGQNYQNAFWDGSQMVYGDSFAVKDVVAHELTHAVTERTANLEYRWQSGALNESLSDIFGVMIDRDDWLMGEDLPPEVMGGRDAIRDLSDPARLGQPAHTNAWVSTCSDNEGVHTNSGIPNKAFYNVATNAATGKEKAERIFYRALTVYLQPAASLEDARAAALQSAQDLYSADTAVYNAVSDGFTAVGLDGAWNPAPNDCICAATITLADPAVYPDRLSALEVATTLYRVRDQLLDRSAAGLRYRRLYEQYAGRASRLLLADPALRAAGGRLFRDFAPGLKELADGTGDQVVVTRPMIAEVTAFLHRLAAADRALGGGELAQAIEQELARADVKRLAGTTFAAAWESLISQ